MQNTRSASSCTAGGGGRPQRIGSDLGSPTNTLSHDDLDVIVAALLRVS